MLQQISSFVTNMLNKLKRGSAPAAQPSHSTSMVPEAIGAGPMADHYCYSCSTEKIQWVSVEKNEDGSPKEIRLPQTQTTTSSYPGYFVAADQHYTDLRQLYAVDSGDHMRYHDIYGRRVFYYAERFPCFDSYDIATENRYYRWFFILGDGTLTRVYYTDEHNQLTVSEDVCSVETSCWEDMLKHGFFEWND